jgi:hypothetical protein
MTEELGKIDKPLVDDFKGGRKLFFVPLIVPAKEFPQEYEDKCERYWEQVDSQISALEIKLGNVTRIFHELMPESGEKAIQHLKDLKLSSYKLIQTRMERGSQLEATEDNDILSELMDWSRCLSIGLQSQKVFSKVYESYNEVLNRRNEFITNKINQTLKENEIAILIMGEGHHIKFDQDIKIFYVAPPTLDEIKRWLRDYEAKSKESPPDETAFKDENVPSKEDPAKS